VCREDTRREWISETSHAMRTRITILRAEIEAVQDGVRPAGAAVLVALHDEILWLSKLVDDVQTVASLEGGRLECRFTPVIPLDALDDAVATFAPVFSAAGLQLDVLDVSSMPRRWVIDGDHSYLWQLFSNILENSLRGTDRGGRLEARCDCCAEGLRLQFDDSGPGISAADMAHLFSGVVRSAKGGGSSVGLAVCARIVEAHGGSIAASPSPLGGLRIVIILPGREAE
jgi:two-component system, OmpR family, sensor histidine kinase BaeS